MRILITGGAGFNGSALALHFQSRGHKVVVLDNLVRRGSELNLPLFQRHGIDFFHGDVRCREDFAQLPSGIDLLCEASAQASVVTGYCNPLFDLHNNSFGLINCLEFARLRSCPLIFWSSNRVYSAAKTNALPRRELATRYDWDADAYHKQSAAQPVPGFDPVHGISEDFSIDGPGKSIYGLSKIIADLACQEYADAFGVKTVINRFGVISGEGQFGKADQGWFVWWAVAHYFGIPLKYIGYRGKQVRDILFIEDVCRLVDLQIENIDRIAGQVFNLGGGRPNSVSLVEATAMLQQKLGREVPITNEDVSRKADQILYFTDNRKAERVLGWSPRITLSEGYDRILSWLRKHEAELRPLYATSAIHQEAGSAR